MTEQLSNIAKELTAALTNAERAHSALEIATSKLQPLEAAAKEADNAVHVLMNQYQSLTGGAPATSKRGRSKGAYNISPESKVQATIKRTTTKALNAGSTQKEAEKIGKAAGEKLARKLGL